MSGKKRAELPRALVRAQGRYAAWRRTRQPRARIPERLWALAVKLVSDHGLHRTASALNLDYYSLKKRVDAANDQQEAAPAFVELPPAIESVRECVIEVEDGQGRCLRVRLRGYDAQDVAAVGCRLRSGQ